MNLIIEQEPCVLHYNAELKEQAKNSKGCISCVSVVQSLEDQLRHRLECKFSDSLYPETVFKSNKCKVRFIRKLVSNYSVKHLKAPNDFELLHESIREEKIQ